MKYVNYFFKTPASIVLMIMCCIHSVPAQQSPGALETNSSFYENHKFNIRFTLSSYLIVHGGWGISFSAASWVDNKGLQPAMNVCLNGYFKGSNMGNAKFYGEKSSAKLRNPNRMLVNVIFSPTLTTRLFTVERTYYDEVNPFYYGSSTSNYNNYMYAITLGTSFVTMPRGTYNNIMTARNRTQQLFYLQLKARSVQLNMYEDYFGITTGSLLQWLCDNRDRYYTGGGNIQARVAHFFKLKFYSEMYTGNSFVDRQDFPDNAYPDQRPHQMNKRRMQNYNRKYAYQDPGQQSFNKARNFLCVEMDASAWAKYYHNKNILSYPKYFRSVQLIIGRQGGMQNMWQQNLIHNHVSIDRDNKVGNHASSLHQFDYTDNFFPKTIYGFGTSVTY